MALPGFVTGWEAPSLPQHPVFSFLAAVLQPQNRQIMNELECYKNVINVYLDREIYLLRELSQWAAALWRTWVTTTLGQR